MSVKKHLVVASAYLAMAVFVMRRIWVDPDLRVPPGHEPDPDLFKFFLAFGARSVTHWEFPLFTTLTGYPEGANVLANTSVLGLGVPGTPVTLLFGAGVTFVLMLTLGMAGAAFGWYLVLRDHAGCSTVAAAIGGALCGFSPAMVSHALGHLHLTAAFLIPFIVLFTLRLRGERPILNGLILGLLITWQVFIGAELLLLCALALGAFVAVYALLHRDLVRPVLARFLRGLAVAGGVASVLLAFPLWFWFFGPQSYRGLGVGAADFGADLGSFLRLPTQSLLGDRSGNAGFAQNYAEENTFFGWPLIVAALLALVVLRKVRNAWALAAVAGVFAVASLGATVTLEGRAVATGPWKLVSGLPLLDSVIPARFGFIVGVATAALIALAIDRLWAEKRFEGLAVIALAVLTLVPTSLPGGPQSPVPRFISSGGWQGYVPSGMTLFPVPPPTPEHPDSLRWVADTVVGFATPKGYFLRPEDNRRGAPGTFWPKDRYVAKLLAEVERTGTVPVITSSDREQAAADVRYWNCAVFVLHERQARALQFQDALTQLFGPPRKVDDVWLWDVRNLAVNDSSS